MIWYDNDLTSHVMQICRSHNCLSLQIPDLQERSSHETNQRLQQRAQMADMFFEGRQFPEDNPQPKRIVIGDCLLNWIRYSSWSYCQSCHSVDTNQITTTFGKRFAIITKKCICSGDRYSVVNPENFSHQLKHIQKQDQHVLAVYHLHVGSMSRLQHGYRYKDGGVTATLTPHSVLDKI